MEEDKDKRFYSTKLFLILVICLVFLRIGSEIHKTRRFNEANERANERASERASEFAREANERASEREKDLEKQREAFRKKWGEEPTF